MISRSCGPEGAEHVVHGGIHAGEEVEQFAVAIPQRTDAHGSPVVDLAFAHDPSPRARGDPGCPSSSPGGRRYGGPAHPG